VFYPPASDPKHPGRYYEVDPDSDVDDSDSSESEYGITYDQALKDWKRDTNDHQDAAIFAQQFSLNLTKSITLLRTCRQVYHEAAPICYGYNTFIFTRLVARHSHHRYNNRNILNDYHPVNRASQWLKSIGSQYNLLRKVVIDISNFCSHWYMDDDRINLRPLLQVVWDHPQAQCDISFGRVASLLAEKDLWWLVDHFSSAGHTHRRTIPYEEKYDDHEIMELQNTLVALGRRDLLSLRRNAHIPGFIGPVVVTPLSSNFSYVSFY
jgi:hypothetical protein